MTTVTRPSSHRASPSASRRTMLRVGLLGAASAFVGWGALGCSSRLAETRLTLATGFSQGVYYTLGRALAQAWQSWLDLTHPPVVRATAGSVENLQLLANGEADVIFSAADVADTAMTTFGPPRRAPRALARVYDDVLHVVVPADSPIRELADLRGRRVSIGASDSQVIVAANRLLAAAGLDPARDLSESRLGLDDSAAALREGQLDAFFWSGGMPTGGLNELAKARPIRLLDLSSVASTVRHQYPVYHVGTVPAATYGIPEPVTTLLVRNFLLVAAEMPDELAGELVAALFAERDRLVRANPVARAIDTRSAIGTQPIPLHPGAERYYRAVKNDD